MTRPGERPFTLVITGGGTGGHLFPGIAVAQALLAKRPESGVVFIGTNRAVDSQAMIRYGFSGRVVPCGALKGKGWLAKVKTLAQLPWGLWRAWRALGEIAPDVVLGVGGYVTGPVILAAKLRGIATAIHEQNSIPGLTNRKLAGLVDRVFVSIPGSERYFGTGKCLLTGNPLRREILALAGQAPVPDGPPTLLILGGSQGAHRLNTLLPEALKEHKGALPPGLTVIHQTGRADEAAVRAAYQTAGIKAEVAAFFPDMAQVYALATLVISRAGATTLAELTALGKAAILVPYPFAADNHQQQNALAMVEGGAARLLVEGGLTAQLMGQTVVTLVNDHALRQGMGQAARRLARPEAAETILEECFSLAQAKIVQRRQSHV